MVTQTKDSLQTPGSADQRLKIKDHKCLVTLTETMESAKHNNKEAVEAIQKLDFGEDSCNTNQYSKTRVQNNDILKIINIEIQNILPFAYSLHRHSQPTTASLERSFSIQKKLLAKDKNFKAENVKHYT